MRVSIIIPTHRERGYIDETIASVLRNARADDEIIVVPNGSAPDYLERLRRDLPDRCVLVELPTGGVAHARNAGCAHASGDAVLFLDDDDLLISGGLEYLRVALAENPQWGAVAGDVIRFDATGEVGAERHKHPWQRITDLRLLGQSLTSPGAVLLSRRLFVSAGGFLQEFAPAEDLELWLRVALIAPVVGLPVPMLYYRVHGEAVSSAPGAMVQRHMQIFRDHVRFRVPWSFPASLRQAALKVYRWYSPRLRVVRDHAVATGQRKLLLATLRLEAQLLLLLLCVAVRSKLVLLSRARWRVRPADIEEEDTQRGHMISSTAEAPKPARVPPPAMNSRPS